MKKIKVAIVFGTRPEAIKMCPLVLELKKRPEFDVITIVTAQHRQMLDQVLNLFEIKPDIDLNIMKPNQNLWGLTSEILTKTGEIFEQNKYDIVLVHGDTTTAFATALSAYYAHIPIGHVEAGLRTYNINNPFPEEVNRVFADVLSNLYFAPTDLSIKNLARVPEVDKKNIYKTGNTVIDALFWTISNTKTTLDFLNLNEHKKTILVTAHRRENFGKPLKSICSAILKLATTRDDIEFVYPVHMNPNVRKTVEEMLSNNPNIRLVEPLEYEQFSLLMKKATLILTDSGGVQEEAPSLGVPVLVLRNETERPEAIEANCVQLVGSDENKIVSTVNKLLDNEDEYYKMAHAASPYGDGTASAKIAEAILNHFSH